MEPKVFWGNDVARGAWQSWPAMNRVALILMGDWCDLLRSERKPDD